VQIKININFASPTVIDSIAIQGNDVIG